MKEKFQQIKGSIGNTPLAEIEVNYKNRKIKIYAKIESYNLTGSIKDRMAYYVLQQAYKNGTIKKGDYICEATSGNTGISFSALGAMLGHEVVIFMPEWMSDERKKILKSYGADVRLVTFEEGGFAGSVEKTKEFAKNNENTFLPGQFVNEDNINVHYYETGEKIISDFKKLGLQPDAIVAGVGTGGTIMGVSKRIKEECPEFKAFPLEPVESPAMADGIMGGVHRIEGIGDGFIPDIVNLELLDEVIKVYDGDSIIMAQMLASKGLGVGISSGANILGAIKVLEKLGEDKTVVTIIADDNKKYLTTDLMKDIDMKDEFLTKDIEIVNINYHR